MKPPPFTYHRPESVAEVTSLLASLENSKLLAGGQSLMPMMNYRYVLPDHVIDLNRCAGLAGIDVDNDTICIGAMTRQRTLERDAAIRRHLPLMVDALHWVGHIQTRNRGTIGGSLAHLDPAAELPAVLAAYDAVLVVLGPSGERRIDTVEWSLGYMTPNLGLDELIVRIEVPMPVPDHHHAFVEVARRHGDFAQAGAGVVLVTDKDDAVVSVAIAVTGVDTGPRRLPDAERLLTGARPNAALIAQAAEYAAQLPGITDVHADEHYRQRIARVVTRRALTQALAPGN